MKKLLFLVILAVLLGHASQAQIPQYYMAVGTSNNVFPFGSTTNKVQWLYYPTDFTSLPPTGFISKLYFRAWTSGPYTVTYTNLTIKMGPTAITSFTGGTWIPGLTQVYNASTTAFSAIPSGGWFSVVLPTPYYYDNTQNLIIEISQDAYSGSMIANCYGGAGNRRIYGTAASSGGTAGTTCGDIGIDIFAGFPCVDTPKSLVNAPLKVCPGDTFKVQPATFYANATYKWQYSYNGVTWSNVTATLDLYGGFQDVIYQPKWYRCKVFCNANPNLIYTSPGQMVDIRPFYYCYCKNKASVTNGLDIGNFTVVNNSDGKELLNNGNPLPMLSNSAANKAYTPYYDTFANSQPVQIVNLYRDTAYRFRVTQMNSGPSVTSGTAYVYLDMNRDGIYDVKTELVLQKTITAANGSTEDTFTIPPDASIGITGMRVQIQNGINLQPCDNLPGDGEVEDYLANISYEPCKGPVYGGRVDGDTSACVGYDYVVTDTSYENRKSAFSRHWQVSGDNKMWFDVSGSDNKDTLARVFSGQPLFYRNQLVCNPTNDTSYSQTLKVNLKAGYKCYCFSQAVGGKALDSSDIGGFSLAAVVNNDGGTHLLNARATHKRTDHTDEAPIEIDADSVYRMTVFHTMTSATHNDAKVTVFMDFNNNNVYDLPEDLIYTGFTNVSTYTLIDNVVVKPIAIMNVPTGMRIILNNDIAPNIPSDQGCGTYTSGETEDYMIMFRKNTTGVNTIRGISDLGLYPNPTEGKFSIAFSSEQDVKHMEVRITNVTGQEIKKESYELSGGKFIRDIDLSGTAKGVYFVELSSEGQKMIRKLVIQ